MSDTESSEPTSEKKELKLSSSKDFNGWLTDNNASLAFTSARVGKVLLLGTNLKGETSLFDRTLENPSAIHYVDNELFIATSYQVWRFRNTLSVTQETKTDYDCLFAPRESHVTGEIGISSLSLDNEGTPLFASTLFSTIGTTSSNNNFKPLWKPGFISQATPETRCFLNGMAVDNGEPKYATAWCESDEKMGWMKDFKDSGVVVDISSNEVVCSGLTMPRVIQLRGDKLWLGHSGTGYLGTVDVESKKFDPVIFCPGYISALEFIGDFAVVALSRPTGDQYKKWPLGEELEKRKIEPWCGLFIIDLKSNKLVHWFRIEGFISEINDLTVIDGFVRPSLIGFRNEQVKKYISVG